MNRQIFSVTQAVSLAKEVLEDGIGPLWIEGELSGFKRHQPSGHLYFELKDARSRVSCVMWRERAKRIGFEPADGNLLRAHGRFGIYELQGRFQLYVEQLEPAGLGELQAALERLKQTLAAEGLFAVERKRALPAYPERIGVATSESGAAVRDFLRVLSERWPIGEIVLRPCTVQGEGASGQIVAALADLQKVQSLDLILLGRGGGSLEDLWCFNEEPVVRAIVASQVPVVTGIGHEVDVTLADLAADLRGATPSQAAELSVPDRREVGREIRARSAQLRQQTESRLRQAGLHLSRLEGSHGMRRPTDLVQTRVQRLDELSIRLRHAADRHLADRTAQVDRLVARWRSQAPMERLKRSRDRLHEFTHRTTRAVSVRIREARERLLTRARHLEAVGPRSVLSRGYAICLRPSDRRAVRSWEDVGVGDPVEVVLGEGALGCTIEERHDRWKTEGAS